MPEPVRIQQPQPKLPMRWHRFLIYFGLWAAGAFLLYAGAVMFATASEEDLREAPEWVCYGIAALCMASAGLHIYTRFSLAYLERSGPRLLYLSTVLFFACLVAIAFGGGMLSEIAERGDMSELLSTAVAGPLVYVGLGVAAGLCEIRYYNRRDHLFVN